METLKVQTAFSETMQSRVDAIIEAMQQRVAEGCHWFDALLQAISLWVAPEETVRNRHYQYLIAGEAFDWLLLAERLSDELDGSMPAHERENLIFSGQPPTEFTEEDLRRAIGNAKYRAHLNYFYGIMVEEALQLAVEEDLLKERRAHVWANGAHLPEDDAFARLYGHNQKEMLETFRKERGKASADEISLAEVKEFTYWLFKYRLNRSDPARVASDTRRGLATLERMRAARRLPQPVQDCDYLDVEVEIVGHR